MGTLDDRFVHADRQTIKDILPYIGFRLVHPPTRSSLIGASSAVPFFRLWCLLTEPFRASCVMMTATTTQKKYRPTKLSLVLVLLCR
jgi:hypothetical protein